MVQVVVIQTKEVFFLKAIQCLRRSQYHLRLGESEHLRYLPRFQSMKWKLKHVQESCCCEWVLKETDALYYSWQSKYYFVTQVTHVNDLSYLLYIACVNVWTIYVKHDVMCVYFSRTSVGEKVRKHLDRNFWHWFCFARIERVLIFISEVIFTYIQCYILNYLLKYLTS